MPKSAEGARALVESLARLDPRLTVRPVFGQPTAFLNGQMCFGTFGPDLFLRVGPEGLDAAARAAGARPFEPMAGRPMAGYLTLPLAKVTNEAERSKWVRKAIAFTETLPPKAPPKRRGATKAPGLAARKSRP